MRKGFLVGSIMVFFLMMFFGIMGMIAYAKDPESYDADEKFAFLAFFDLLAPLGNGWHIVVLILVTALAASSIDSLQTGLTSVFSHDLVKLGYAPKQITRLLVVIINIPAIYLASEKYDVLSLFLVADLVCSTSVFPVFLGLQTTDYGILKAPTELGAFMGCVAGVVTVLINGVVNNAEGGIFEYFWLENEAICALCGSKTMVSFILTPVVSCIMTYVFTIADLAVRGERARQPIFTIAWDEKDVSKMVSESSDEGENEWDDMPKDTEAVAVDTEAVAMDADIVEVDSEKDDVIKPIETLMSSEVYTDA
jgi:Na+/proline symporter